MKSEKNTVFFLDKLLLFDGYGESRESHHITTKTFAAQHQSFKALLNAAVSGSWPLALCCGVAWWWFVLGKLQYVCSMGYNEQGMFKNAHLDVIMGN